MYNGCGLIDLIDDETLSTDQMAAKILETIDQNESGQSRQPYDSIYRTTIASKMRRGSCPFVKIPLPAIRPAFILAVEGSHRIKEL
jgi:hypothetical protein